MLKIKILELGVVLENSAILSDRKQSMLDLIVLVERMAEADARNLAAVRSVLTQEPPFNLFIFLIVSLALFEKTDRPSAVTRRTEKSIVGDDHLSHSEVFASNRFLTFHN